MTNIIDLNSLVTPDVTTLLETQARKRLVDYLNRSFARDTLYWTGLCQTYWTSYYNINVNSCSDDWWQNHDAQTQFRFDKDSPIHASQERMRKAAVELRRLGIKKAPYAYSDNHNYDYLHTDISVRTTSAIIIIKMLDLEWLTYNVKKGTFAAKGSEPTGIRGWLKRLFNKMRPAPMLDKDTAS